MKLIPLTQGKFAKVDDEDFEWLNKWNWCYHHQGYAIRSSPKINGKSRHIFMHREIKNTPIGYETDHINGDKLDNQKTNLRICNKSQNQGNRGASSNNTSGKRGVYWSKQKNKWHSRIVIHGKSIHLGFYELLDDAAHAYDVAAKQYFGEFVKSTLIEEN